MSERYPVGTKVQVANGGLGSRFRNEDERVGEFAGTVIATSGSSYTGIPEVCVESDDGERRMLMVGDLEEAPAAEPTARPAMKTIRLTSKMADALGCTIEINGRPAMIMSHPKTQESLVARGLATEHGYLTDQGRFVAHLISVGRDTPYYWTWDAIEAGTRTWLSDQKRHAEASEDDSEQVTRDTAPAAEPTTRPTMDKVKIWYESGAYEEVTAEHERFAELAAIFSECQVNGRIAAAELYEGNGNAQGFRRVDQADLTAPAPCGRQIDPRSIINEVPDMRPIVCARGHGHRGLHRDTVAIHRDTYKWGDDVCLPVDHKTTEDGPCCGVEERDTGYGYQCTLRGPHTQHQAHGLRDRVFYSWPVDTTQTVD